MTTTDLAKFGSRERKMTEDLLKAWREQGLPIDFYDENVTIMMDTNSGNVFLTDSEYQVARMNGDRLESFYSCPYCGHKGFIEDMEHEPEDEKCTRYLEEIKVPLYLDWGA